MKQLKKGLLLLLALAVFTGFVGCAFIPWDKLAQNIVQDISEPTNDPIKEAYKSDPANFVKFSRSTEPYEQYISIQEMLEYKTQYPDCNGTWFRDQLSGEDLIIYNSYLYALENQFIHITLYVEDSDKDFSYIRELISLDSPFLEQNYNHYEFVWKNPINYIGESISVSMEHFTDSRWKMKMEALDKCRQIVQNIPPEYETQQEKMEYLYNYVCDNVEYVAYENMADESYFYDAVCKGKTNCDGYSNMLSLLFHLIGVECCEVIAHGEEGEAGHTWVAAKLNGVFYNFDATFEDSSELQTGDLIHFGFSDDLVSMNTLEHEEMRPKCTDTSRDFLYADITTNDLTDWSELKRIATLADEKLETGIDTFLIGVKSPVDSALFEQFTDWFFTYFRRGKAITISHWAMRNGSLIEIALS